MEFSSIVLMEVDKDNKFIKELDSYKVEDGGEYIRKFFYNEEDVFVYFYPARDVEDWEYSALYDFFDLDVFEEKGYNIEEKDDEYNPTWIVKLDYIEERKDMAEKLSELCILIKEEMIKAFEEAEKNKTDYEEEEE
ncbi:hypothetical protein SH2C18_37570 [Clostridium sediminicola]|uniref:DUF6762 family protein n=1 Tax=Clostridium sediminicola TaxID=3114879 RepID=UPI0031F20C64